MTEVITPPADTDTTKPVLGRDGTPHDQAREDRLIDRLRNDVDAANRAKRGSDAAVVALVANRALTPENLAAIAAAVPPAPAAAPGADLAAVAKVLGVEATDVATVVEAATQARLSGELYGIIAEAGADPMLTRAMLNQDRSLVDIDLSAPDLHDRLKTIVSDTVKAHPNLKVRREFAAVSGVPFGAGSGGAPSHVSKEDLAWMTPAQISAARRAGLLEHLNVGKG